jgi:hypothetical protein
MKFNICDTIIRGGRKEPRTVLAHENDGYRLSDTKNGFGSIWWNKYIVETQFKKVT